MRKAQAEGVPVSEQGLARLNDLAAKYEIPGVTVA